MAAPYAGPDDAARADAFFAGRPAAQALFTAIADLLADHGDVTVTATKVRVCVKARTRFLYCPQTYTDGRIILRFLLPYALEGDWHQMPAGGRVAHRVTLGRIEDAPMDLFRAALEVDLAASAR